MEAKVILFILLIQKKTDNKNEILCDSGRSLWRFARL